MEYTTLWDMTSQLLLLSHGQASVETGFSVNKQIERTNMCHKTFISERLVNDRVRSVGGVMAIEMTKYLMTPCRASRSRYSLLGRGS